MKNITSSNLDETKSTVDSATVEKSVKYATDEGEILEKTSVTYKKDKGNIIDNTVNTIKSSESIKNVTNSAKSGILKLIKLAIILGITGFILIIIGVMMGILPPEN